MADIGTYLERSGHGTLIDAPTEKNLRLGFECNSLGVSREIVLIRSLGFEDWNAYFALIAGSFEPKTGQPWTGDSEIEKWHGYALLVICMLRFYDATVSQDMVYGILGLLERQRPPDFELPIRADYEQSPRDLYTLTAFYFIKHTASLFALSLIESPELRRRQDLPSWVLDFSSPQTTGVLSMQFIEGGPFTACGICVGSPESRKISGATLELEGAYFDEVTEVTTNGWEPKQALASLQLLEEALHIVGTTTTYSKPPIDLLAEVLLCGAETLDAPSGLLVLLGTNTGDGQASTSKDSSLFFRAWALTNVVMAADSGIPYDSVLEAMQTLEEQDLLSAGKSFSAEVQDIFDAIKDSQKHPDDPEPLQVINTVSLLNGIFIVEANKFCIFKKLFRTSRGYIGFGNSSMQVGDQVWMLCGGRTPFILGPALEEETYTLIGETYLSGCMEGEMITEELKARIGPVHLI